MQLRKSLLVLAAPTWLALAALSWIGCGDDAASDATDSGTPDTLTSDSASPDSGTDVDANNPLAIPLGDGGAPYDTWTWIPVAGTQCANGSATGIAINPHAGSTNLTVYFEGGGACWEASQCLASVGLASNLNGFGATEFAAFAGSALPNYALFSRADGANPLAGDSFVYVPYCTGDIHAGNNVATYETDGGSYQIHHVGFANAQKDLAVLQATFTDAARLVVTGSSAGGYGAAFNYEQVHLGFPKATPYLIDDSGPLLPNNLPAYEAQNAAWHYFDNIPAACTNCRPADDDGGTIANGATGNLFIYYTQEANFRGSLLETDHDRTISSFFSTATGLGDEDNAGCVGAGGAIGPGPCVFTTALDTLYTNYIQVGNAAGPGQMHVLIRHDTFHTYLGGSATAANPEYDAELKSFIGAQLGEADAGAWADIVPTPF